MKTATKERPILFSAPMVKAILDGRKTVTRRIVKPQPKAKHLGYMAVDGGAIQCGPDYPDGDDDFIRCPYGQPGDRLWVREAWSRDHAAFYPHFPIIYRADGYDPRDKFDSFQSSVYSPESKRKHYFAWRPSIHMKRADSRLTLEIVSVRVERVQEITEADAQAEGFEQEHIHGGMYETAYSKFSQLWDTLNAKRGYGWESNPWVWRVEFRRLP